MTSPNQIFGFIKSRAKSVREVAKSGLEKFTEAMDNKLKEAQEDLEKYGSLTIFPKFGRVTISFSDTVPRLRHRLL
jgi:hypothetical protein